MAKDIHLAQRVLNCGTNRNNSFFFVCFFFVVVVVVVLYENFALYFKS